MTKILLTLLTCGIIFAGCSSSTEKTEAVNDIPQLPDQTAVTDTAGIQAPAEAAPGTTVPMTISAEPTPQSQPAASASATGLNPAHGEPGHRCDISVGAPLNSPPGNNTAPSNNPVSTTPVTTSPQLFTPPTPTTMTVPPPPTTMSASPAPSTGDAVPATPQAATAPGMNPPHGQPGHDCSIAVGAPLKK